MARCRCGALDSCGCLIAGGDGVTISGTGNPGAPWIIDVDPRATGAVDVDDTIGLDMTMTGKGVAGDPYVIYGNVKLAELLSVLDTPDVDLTLTPDPLGGPGFILSATVKLPGVLTFVDTPEVNFIQSGSGTVADPLLVSADLPLVELDTAANTGDVLTRGADGVYRPGPPTTAPVGAVSVSVGIMGDGSSGNPLRITACTYDDFLTWCPTTP